MGKFRIIIRVLRSPLGRTLVIFALRNRRIRQTIGHFALRQINRRLRRK